MAKVKTSFEHLWNTRLEAKAREGGAIDGDIHKIRMAAKNLLVAAGWAQPDGTCDFVSAKDLETCVMSAAATIESATHKVVAERRVVQSVRPGNAPTKAQVMAGVAAGPAVALESANVSAAFHSATAKLGDKCPRCSGSMAPVGLVNDRAGIYCTRDRVVLPLSNDYSMRY